MKTFAHLYKDDYFTGRQRNDEKRLKSFLQEKAFMLRHMPLAGAVCDVGCSTGEFLDIIGWNGPRFGMEVNPAAIEVAKQSGINFDKSILTEENFFDAVIFRGTIQHIPDPFLFIGAAHKALKKGGTVVFLATPNANSIVYKLFNTLPALDPILNFYVPSDVTLSDVLRNYEFAVVDIEYPYLSSPYARPVADLLNFFTTLATRKKPRFAFWRNMMNVIARKP
jgi:2-polyprenyl-3-methyl-5-hydroxy-6-metoxy-1,4-benzoquinol methylase